MNFIALNVPSALVELSTMMKQTSLGKVESFNKGQTKPMYCVCRRGIDSRSAVALLTKAGFQTVKDIKGGLTKWSKVVDPEFPTY